MNVAGLGLDSIDEDTIDKLDDRRVNISDDVVVFLLLNGFDPVQGAADNLVEVIHIDHGAIFHIHIRPAPLLHPIKRIILGRKDRGLLLGGLCLFFRSCGRRRLLGHHRPSAAVIRADGLLNARFTGDCNLHVISRHEFHIVDGEDIGRVGHGNGQRRAYAGHGHNGILPCHLDRDKLDH